MVSTIPDNKTNHFTVDFTSNQPNIPEIIQAMKAPNTKSKWKSSMHYDIRKTTVLTVMCQRNEQVIWAPKRQVFI